MIFDTRQIILRDGKNYTLRTPGVGDGAAMLEYMVGCAGESEFVIRYPDEYWESADDMEKQVLRDRESPYNLTISCFEDENLIASAVLRLRPQRKLRHRATVGIGVRKAYWGKGLGTLLMGLLIEEARKIAGLYSLELGYLSDNDRAKVLYEKLGFREICTMPGAFITADGIRDEIFMLLEL